MLNNIKTCKMSYTCSQASIDGNPYYMNSIPINPEGMSMGATKVSLCGPYGNYYEQGCPYPQATLHCMKGIVSDTTTLYACVDKNGNSHNLYQDNDQCSAGNTSAVRK
jgi:hypothetical protein